MYFLGPGLLVIGVNSYPEGRGFESQHRILNGHFTNIFVVKIVVCLKKTKINKKEAGYGPFYKEITCISYAPIESPCSLQVVLLEELWPFQIGFEVHTTSHAQLETGCSTHVSIP